MKQNFAKIVAEMKSRPGSHLTAFLVIHEVTALLAFPLVYPIASISNKWLLEAIPDSFQQRTSDSLSFVNKKINKARNYFGYDSLNDHHPFVLNMTTSYVLVKLLMPLRLAGSLWLTPIAVRLMTSSKPI